MSNYQDHRHSDATNGSGGIAFALALNLIFTVIEIFGGIWTNSVAILADAVHDLGDTLALASAWYFQKISGRQEDRRYSYGYRRFSLLGATITAMVLFLGGLYILSEAIPRLFHPETANAKGMLGFAILGIVVNGLGALRVVQETGYNARIVAWHLFEDVLGWTAILFAGVVLLFKEIPIIDPLLSILITLYVLYNVGKNLKGVMTVFLQAVPDGIDMEALNRDIVTVDGVVSTHHTHLWSLDGEHHVFSAHVVVAASMDSMETDTIKDRVRQLVLDAGIGHTTLEMERASNSCKTADESPPADNSLQAAPNGKKG